jgi:hypothetical protein
MATPPDWNQLRAIMQAWLASQNRTPNSLANEAGINRSTLSRFLNADEEKQAGSLKTCTTLEIYRVIYPDLDFWGRRAFLKAAGLSPLIFEVSNSLLIQENVNPDRIEGEQ